MEQKSIPESDLDSTCIGHTGVTVMDIICALCDVVDGNPYDIQYTTGYPLERCKEIINTSDSVEPIWLKQP